MWVVLDGSLYSFINWNGGLLPGNRFGIANILLIIVVATLPPTPILGFEYFGLNRVRASNPQRLILPKYCFSTPAPRCFGNHYYHISWLKVFYDTVIAFFVFPYLVLFSFVILHPLSCISSSCLHISGLQQAFLHIYHHRIVGEDHHTSGISFDSPYHRLHCRRSTDPIFPNYRSRELEPKY